MFLRIVRRAMVAVLAGAITVVVPATAAHAAVNCEVTYRTSAWSDGFAASIRLTNPGDAWDSYALRFSFRGGETVTRAWQHGFVQSGPNVTISSEAGARPVPTGGSVRLGFVGRHTGTTSTPANIQVNGVYCALAGEPHVIVEPDLVTYSESNTSMQAAFTMRLSQPPVGPDHYAIFTRTGSGIWITQPIVYYFNSSNWNLPQTYYLGGAPDNNTVDDRMVLTVSVKDYAPDTVIMQQIDRG
ncbi:cellulose binding domain-containing protein [Phytohabitans aurantiacus]|jgi:hypothetical protein|nr:cellulose binding domain-containing protein [Phytohabitans aurantiacus]